MTADRYNRERPPIIIGERYPFHSTLVGNEPGGVYPHRFSGQTVTVLSEVTDVDPEVERLFNVRADNGIEFSAWEGELNGWYFDTGQWCQPNGTWADGLNA